MRRVPFLFFFLFALAAGTAGQAADNEPGAFGGQKIVVAGTGDSQELLRVMAEAFERKFPGAKIEIPDSVGSGGGIKALLGGECDLARVARPLKEIEIKEGLTYVPFAQNPVVFVVHPSVTGVDNLYPADIIGIYSGKITEWEQIGAYSGKIYPITREPGDSSRKVLNAHLPGFFEIADPRAKVSYTTPDTVTLLTVHKNTIGYLPLAATKGTALKALMIDHISPSVENIRNGSYKFILSFAMVTKVEPVGLAKAFIDFLFSEEGRKIIFDFGAIPDR